VHSYAACPEDWQGQLQITRDANQGTWFQEGTLCDTHRKLLSAFLSLLFNALLLSLLFSLDFWQDFCRHESIQRVNIIILLLCLHNRTTLVAVPVFWDIHAPIHPSRLTHKQNNKEDDMRLEQNERNAMKEMAGTLTRGTLIAAAACLATIAGGGGATTAPNAVAGSSHGILSTV
jgi:hypothetical protein